MLVCSVASRARRTVAGTIAEIGAATDAVNTLGLGQLVEESASAVDAVSVISSYGAAILEAASAADVSSATLPGAVAAAVVETATAADLPDAATVSITTARSAMTDTVFVNSDGTARQANVGGTMVNL